MEELSLLTRTAGAAVLHTIVQNRNTPDRAFYIGRGKSEELAALVEMSAADLVVFNDELSPSQIRNLDRIIEAKVIDRTALILDIFARRALSKQGKLQVEMAQMQYLLPRLTGLGNQLSRLGGGIGTRGPGETQLEVDRRVIRRRISELKKEIRAIREHRNLHRLRRKRNRCSVISLVGYTNAGKSTLLNALTGADLHTEDMLFATLDPMVRRGYINGGREVLYTDTVGFIRKLPEQLVTAFQATLEEISAADLLLHVIDLSHPDYLNQLEVVRRQLAALDTDYFRRELPVFNKTDLIEKGANIDYLEREFSNAVFVSAWKNEGLEALKEKISLMLLERQHRIKLHLPYSEGRIYAELQQNGEVESMTAGPEHMEVVALIDPDLAEKLRKYVVTETLDTM